MSEKWEDKQEDKGLDVRWKKNKIMDELSKKINKESGVEGWEIRR